MSADVLCLRPEADFARTSNEDDLCDIRKRRMQETRDRNGPGASEFGGVDDGERFSRRPRVANHHANVLRRQQPARNVLDVNANGFARNGTP